MGKKFNFEVAETLSTKLNTVADLIESENAEMKTMYSKLGDTFLDAGYATYQISFDECDRDISVACAELRELSASLMIYAQALREAM